MNDSLFPFFVGAISAFVIFFLREWKTSSRSELDISRSKSVNLINMIDVDYFSNATNNSRKKVEEAGGIENHLYEHDSDLYRLGVSVQMLGSACMLGAVDTQGVLMLNAPQIVRDWVLVQKNIKHVREQEGSRKGNKQDMPFSRRHGEWLALVAYMWLDGAHFRLQDRYHDATDNMLKIYSSKRNIARIERAIFASDQDLLTKCAVKSRNQLIAKMWQFKFWAFWGTKSRKAQN